MNHFNLFENKTEPNENALIIIREMKRKMIKAWRIKNPFGNVKLKIQFQFILHSNESYANFQIWVSSFGFFHL